jgi:hypothetical protein
LRSTHRLKDSISRRVDWKIVQHVRHGKPLIIPCANLGRSNKREPPGIRVGFPGTPVKGTFSGFGQRLFSSNRGALTASRTRFGNPADW